MSLVIDKPRLSDIQLQELNIELITSAGTNTLTEQRFDEIVEAFAECDSQNLIYVLVQGDVAWRQKYAARFSGSIYGD
jgi:hypothetical protein